MALVKVVVFTPTHEASHLVDLARSLAEQRLSEGVELHWRLGLNGSLRSDEATSSLAEAFRVARQAGIVVKLLDIHEHAPNIGALKRALCMGAIEEGADLLVEADHDDLLARDAISALVKEMGGPVFLYSNTAHFSTSPLETHGFSSFFGWESAPLVADAPGLDGFETVSMRAFPPSARSFCQILYAPDHVRAWSKEAYLLAGGHDPTWRVCDDHDLLCRTYLNTNIRIEHVDRCLYHYRRQPGNTFAGPWNMEIQRLSGQGTHRHPDGSAVPDFAQPIALRDRYLHPLVEAEARRKNGRLLDIGGALNTPRGWTSLDLQGGDISRDLRRGLPFQDNSVFALRAFDVLEHLAPADAAFVLSECWRVLEPGGWLLTRTPADSGPGAACDLSHLSRWNTRSFAYFWSKELLPYREQAYPGLKAAFQPVRIFEEMTTCGPWPCQWQVPYVVADLLCMKDGLRPPGALFM